MLKRAEPPICVGLYARWGSGKTFMISLLKREFDWDVREDPHTLQLLQFFEEGYHELEAKQATPAEEPETVRSLIFGLLLTILLSCMPSLPYGVTTFASIISDAFDVSGALCAVWAWCSRLRRSCGKKGRTTDISDDLSNDWLPWRQSLKANFYKEYRWLPQEEEVQKNDAKKEVIKEFIFVDFNAWECAACIHLSSSIGF